MTRALHWLLAAYVTTGILLLAYGVFAVLVLQGYARSAHVRRAA